jgi:hypothetical protein
VLVAIAFSHDPRAKEAGERSDLEVRRGAVDIVEQRPQMGPKDPGQSIGRAPAALTRRRDGGQHAVERAILTVKEDFVLTREVVVEIRRREIRGVCDLAHARLGKPAVAEDPGRGAQNLVPPRIAPPGPSRSTER